MNDTTLIIPAHNRPDRLRRLLNYYNESGLDIIVSDSSSTKFNFVKEFPDIIYRHFPKAHFLEKTNAILHLIKTPYVVFCADDDFIVPSALRKITCFLDENPAYITAHGHYLTFSRLKANKIEFTPRYIRNLYNDIDQKSASARIVAYKCIYASILYAVCRTEVFKQMYNDALDKTGSPLFNNLYLVEEYFNLYTLISGKHIVLPVFYSARERIEGSAASTTIPLDIIMTDPSFEKEYDNFLNILSCLLSVNDNILQEDAKKQIHDFLRAKYINEIPLKSKVIKFIVKYDKTNIFTHIFDRRYKTKGLKAVKGLEIYPCEFSTPEKEAILQAIQTEKNVIH